MVGIKFGGYRFDTFLKLIALKNFDNFDKCKIFEFYCFGEPFMTRDKS